MNLIANLKRTMELQIMRDFTCCKNTELNRTALWKIAEKQTENKIHWDFRIEPVTYILKYSWVSNSLVGFKRVGLK